MGGGCPCGGRGAAARGCGGGCGGIDSATGRLRGGSAAVGGGGLQALLLSPQHQLLSVRSAGVAATKRAPRETMGLGVGGIAPREPPRWRLGRGEKGRPRPRLTAPRHCQLGKGRRPAAPQRLRSPSRVGGLFPAGWGTGGGRRKAGAAPAAVGLGWGGGGAAGRRHRERRRRAR